MQNKVVFTIVELSVTGIIGVMIAATESPWPLLFALVPLLIWRYLDQH